MKEGDRKTPTTTQTAERETEEANQRLRQKDLIYEEKEICQMEDKKKAWP